MCLGAYRYIFFLPVSWYKYIFVPSCILQYLEESWLITMTFYEGRDCLFGCFDIAALFQLGKNRGNFETMVFCLKKLSRTATGNHFLPKSGNSFLSRFYEISSNRTLFCNFRVFQMSSQPFSTYSDAICALDQ